MARELRLDLEGSRNETSQCQDELHVLRKKYDKFLNDADTAKKELRYAFRIDFSYSEGHILMYLCATLSTVLIFNHDYLAKESKHSWPNGHWKNDMMKSAVLLWPNISGKRNHWTQRLMSCRDRTENYQRSLWRLPTRNREPLRDYRRQNKSLKRPRYVQELLCRVYKCSCSAVAQNELSKLRSQNHALDSTVHSQEKELNNVWE